MLVTLKEILKSAEENKCAIGSFNTPNMTSAQAVIAAAEELQRPVILMHAQVHEEMGLCKMVSVYFRGMGYRCSCRVIVYVIGRIAHQKVSKSCDPDRGSGV